MALLVLMVMGNPSPVTLPPSSVVLHPAMPAMPLTLVTPSFCRDEIQGIIQERSHMHLATTFVRFVFSTF